MAANYPGSFDTMGDPGAQLSTNPHSALHNQVNDVIEAIEAELGVNPSGAAATVAARFTALTFVNVQTFTTSGTWTKPAGAVSVVASVIAGGGGGGSGRRGAAASIRSGGSGGGGGSQVTRTMPASVCGATESVTVGTGGAGAAAASADNTNGSNGTVGTQSSFGALVYAYPGSPGGAGSGATPTGGGLSGTRLYDSNTGVLIGGGHGGVGFASGTPAQPDAELLNGGGGGGGGGAGIDAANVVGNGGIGGNRAQSNSGGGAGGGGAGFVGTASTVNLAEGGAGGGGGAGNGFNGGAGGLYGGGGGGGGGVSNGFVSGAGGAGAAGIVVVISYL